MLSWQDILDGADGLINTAKKFDDYKNPQSVETTAPQPDPDREPEISGGFQGFGQLGLQSSLGVVGAVVFVYLLATR